MKELVGPLATGTDGIAHLVRRSAAGGNRVTPSAGGQRRMATIALVLAWA
jgi:hypothetical protein